MIHKMSLESNDDEVSVHPHFTHCLFNSLFVTLREMNVGIDKAAP